VFYFYFYVRRNVSIDDDNGRHLFYALAESASRQPDRDPLVLWLNGGPGCSSLGGGFLSELGPVYPTPNGRTLIRNHFSWNHVANMLFLESPAFVGWSWSAREEDKRVGDSRTAQDSLKFVLQFLKRFPKYRDRPLWLAGESYAGHYIPQLALEILQHNQQLGMVRSNSVKDAEGRINLKGFLVGEFICEH
jgi:serine carboxypeptidase-like clade 2